MQLNRNQHQKRVQNGDETQFSDGNIPVPLCQIVLFNIVKLSHST